MHNKFLYGVATLAVLIVLGVGLLTLFPNPESTLTQPPTTAEFVLQFDGEPDRLQRPVSIDIDQQGNLYVVDQGNFRVQKFDHSGNPLTQWGESGSGDGQFLISSSHNGLAIDGQSNVYVTDINLDRIQKFDSNDQFLTKWGKGRAGAEVGDFYTPHDVAVDAQDNVYVIDCILDEPFQVVKFDSNGQLLTKWDIIESEGKADIAAPSHHIAVDGEGNVYVANEQAHHIQKFDGDGKLLSIIGGPGSGDGQFDTPSGVAVDGQGNLYVADMDNHRIQKFDSSGEFIFKWGSRGSGQGEFKRPVDVVVDAEGNVYVVDMGNDRIQMFRQM